MVHRQNASSGVLLTQIDPSSDLVVVFFPGGPCRSRPLLNKLEMVFGIGGHNQIDNSDRAQVFGGIQPGEGCFVSSESLHEPCGFSHRRATFEYLTEAGQVNGDRPDALG